MNIPPFKIERYFAKYEFNAPYLLSSSDCEAMSIGDLLALEPGSVEAFHNHWLGYTESQGDPALRQSIARMYANCSADDVLVFTGAEEGIFNFMQGVLQAGDHLICHFPCYQSAHSIAKANGVEVSFWQQNEADDWALDLADLTKLLQPNTKAIYVNFPNNPTGYHPNRDLFDGLVEFARQHNLYIFSDEVYRELESDTSLQLPAMCDVYEKALSLCVTSKAYGLAGLRIGWLATRDQAVYGRLLELKDYITICNSAPSEFLARIAMDHRETLAARNLNIITKNLDIADEFFGRFSTLFEWKRPLAGPIAFPKYLGGSALEFSQQVTNEAGIMLLPGTVYELDDAHIRFGFGRQNFEEGITKLSDFLTKTKA
ncbi:MAG: aminotransferase class I/II-fold pyridoxal phosphate-dependent enzyme [Chloroflexota bacterium]